jgi:hypothetical protein
MNFREPTFQELFASSHSQELAKLQSSIFVNKSLATGGITEALKAMPTNLPNSKPYNQVVFERSTASELTTNYIKVNWRVIFVSGVIGGGIVYLVYQINKYYIKNKSKNYFN